MGRISRVARERRKREGLWGNDPRCHWCGRNTELPPKGDAVKMEPHFATMDHLYPVGHPRRESKNHDGEQRVVLSCYECNWTRGEEWGRALRSRNGPEA